MAEDDEIQKAITRGAPPDVVTMLALIDIARTLRDINDQLREIRMHGING